MPIFERLKTRAKEIESLLCVGLDPHPEFLHQANAENALTYCLRIVEQTQEYASAFKPNSAFFEVYGGPGIQALQTLIAAVPDQIPVVLDAKRGDIGSTAKAYARAAFETLGADLLTINGYLGQDAVAPFIDDPEKGVLLLVKTSNPAAGDLQDQVLTNGLTVYERMAEFAQSWSANANIGLVVGATFPETLSTLRNEHPDLWFLTPGIGAQGGDLQAAVQASLMEDGFGALVPISRAIAEAKHPAEAARDFRDQINAARSSRDPAISKVSLKTKLAQALVDLGCVRFGDFTLKSGASSPIYIDLRLLAGAPKVLNMAARALSTTIQSLKFDRIAGLPYAAMPIATALSLQTNVPLIYPRKEVKQYGTSAAIEGPFKPEETALVVDDLISNGASKFEAIEKLEAGGLKVSDIAVLIDRQPKGSHSLEKKNLRLHAVFTLPELLDLWQASGAIDEPTKQSVLSFLGFG